MKEYYFLFGLAFLWTVAAVVQDMKKREIANWLNFSLIAFGLGYRAFYGIFIDDFNFFLYGLFGFGLFYVLAYAFYYTRAFAGGDAKLLMGYGAILPYGSFSDVFFNGFGFVFVLFFVGAVYSLIYSVFLVMKDKKRFVLAFRKRFKRGKYIFLLSFVLALVSWFLLDFLSWIILLILLFFFPLVYLYVRALDVCMVKQINAGNLSEGDWLEKDVKIGGRLVKKSVHGLDRDEIKILKKAKKSVLIREGIPFSPAFLGALIIMVFFYSFLSFQVFELIF